jgi:hypothetical protein
VIAGSASKVRKLTARGAAWQVYARILYAVFREDL